jgi:hypothetical protein
MILTVRAEENSQEDVLPYHGIRFKVTPAPVGEKMAIIRLVLKTHPPVRPGKPEGPPLAAANLTRLYFPGKALPLSILIHIVIFCAVLLLQILGYPIEEPVIPEQVKSIHRKIPRVVMFLPLVGGGSPGMIFPMSESKPPERKQAVARAPRKKGLAYPGPQPIVSDVPKPTNPIQTILQPNLEKPPALQPLLPLPNLVQVAGSRHNQRLEVPEPALRPPEPVKPVERKLPEPPSEQPDVKAYTALPALNLTPAKIETPKLVLPPLKPPPPEPEPPKDELKAAKSALTQSQLESPGGQDSLDLLVLSPVPAPPPQAIEVPAGEARGQFVISPEPNLSSTETEPGTRSESSSPDTADAKAAPAVTAVAGDAAPAATSSFGVSASASKDKGSPEGGPPSTTASGPGSKTGTGSGSGSGSGPGSGAGAGPGKGPFSGITIVGGMPAKGTPAKPAIVKRVRRPLQTSYGLTIVSTETSGGGLPFFDVFSREQVYTVYLDMRRTEEDTAPAWTLEFAVVPGTAYKVDPARVPSQSQQGLVLPFPTFKEQPALPAEAVRKHPGQMVIVYGIVNLQGKMEQISIKQSPDALFTEPVLAALSKWTFRPARLNGEPVPVKVLMGIPLAAPEQ